MNHFRKQSSDNHRAVDGILNAPVRSRLDGQPMGRRVLNVDSLRSSNRRVDAFKRPEGFHASNQMDNSVQQTANAGRSSKPVSSQGSILHMTLPGGALSEKRQRKEKAASGKRKWRSIRKWTLRSTLAFATLLILIGGFLFTKGYFQLNKVFKGGGSAAALQSNVSPDLLKGEGDGRVNVLLLGKGGEGHEGADLTDTVLLASIDPVNKKTALVSIPRDLWVTVPGNGSSKINAVYANAKNAALRKNAKDKKAADSAGIKAVQSVVKDVLGVPIHYYGMVDFKAFEQAVNTVGGVTIDVPEDLVDRTMAWENGGNPVLAKKGKQKFDGRQALMYVRSRHGSARGDFDRSERQRLFIVALSQKVLSAGTYTNPVKMSQLMDTFGDHVSTDFSVNDALRLMSIAKGVKSNNIESIGLADPPNNFLTTGSVNGQSIVRPVDGVGNFDAIRTFIRSKLKDGYIVKEDAKVMVLNGTTTAGYATQKADELRSYGYNVTTVADAPTTDYQKTVLVDLTKGKKPYTENYLEKRFDVKATTKLPNTSIQAGNASFVIILGE